MANEYRSYSDQDLEALAVQIYNVLKTDAVAYGVAAGTVTSLQTKSGDFGDDLVDVQAKRSAWRAAVDNKDVDRGDLEDVISNIANTVYNNSSVTSEMILTLGLEPRSTNRARLQPKQPTALAAKPSADGTVKLAWSPGLNKYGATYLVESRSESGEWSVVFTTTRRTVTLSGFTPGQTAWFRIVAARNNSFSLPSNEVAIYHTGTGDAGLKIAA